jgi:hypothetical protein
MQHQRGRFWFLFVAVVFGSFIVSFFSSGALPMWIRVTSGISPVLIFLVLWRFRPKV